REAISLDTSPDQDAAARAAAQSYLGRTYSLVGQSCVNQSKDATKATGASIPSGPFRPFDFIPKMSYARLKNAALRGRLGVSATVIKIAPSFQFGPPLPAIPLQ